MWKNSQTDWGKAARRFHWVIALLILIEVPTGLIMSKTYGAKDRWLAVWHYWTGNWHHTAGLLMLILAIARLAWRSMNPLPHPLGMRPAFERWLGLATHWFLYALLLLIPLSGWAALSSLADSVVFGKTTFWFFGTNGFDWIVPRIVPPHAYDDKNTIFTYGLFARVHRWMLIVGGGLLTLHIAAALRHHFILRDTTLRRMWFGKTPSARQADNRRGP